MLVSLKWLREYADLPADVDVAELATRLTMASSEVEGVHRTGDWDRTLVTVGQVMAVEPHPQADRLRLVTVDYGGSEPQQVVCGAPNLAVGQRIAFAREGARLIDGHTGEPTTLKRSRIRGVESAGMVLSERELGLSESHDGIIELPSDAPIGAPLADVLGDVILDVHTWPNRADTMSMIGIAREVAAIYGLQLRAPRAEYVELGPLVADAIAVEIDAIELCARYVATVVEGVRVAPSPGWMQERLRAGGIRPINNVVDVTNYVLLELGQPLHAFDLDKLQGDIVVRAAHEGEHIVTLDGEDRALTSGHGVDTLVIADRSGPVALAGVMGGLTTEITDRTTRVLLESARFDPASIRRTSTRLHLRSESSSRFERGLSPELALYASRRATQLLVEICGGMARTGTVDVYPRPWERLEVRLSRGRLDTLLGFHVVTDDVVRNLETLGFEVHSMQDGTYAPGLIDEVFAVRAPWWRTDVSIADDVAEEVLRTVGYDQLPATALRGAVPTHEARPLVELRERLKDALAAAGLREVITYSLTTDEVQQAVIPAITLVERPSLMLQNTLSSDHAVLRQTLRHSILETVASNVRAGAERIAIFEAARVYIPRVDEGESSLPDEREQVCGALSGVEFDRWGNATARRLDFFDAKGVLEELAATFGMTLEYVASEEYGLLPGRTAELRVRGTRVGVLGEVHPATLAVFALNGAVLLFELDLPSLLPYLLQRLKAASPPRFPVVEQAMAIVVDETIPAGALQEVIQQSRLVASARVFDVYRGEQLLPGKKSVAFAVRYQAGDRTLTTEEANREQQRIAGRLEREFGATLRA